MTNKKEPRSKKKILDAAIELLESTSYSALTIEAIAAKAGVGKTTIYRWWENKAYIILDAFLMTTDSRLVFDSDKSLHESFSDFLTNLAAVLDSKIGKSMLTIVTENEEIAKAFYTLYLQPRRSDSIRLLESGMNKGEIRSGMNLDGVLDMMFGPIYFHILIYKKNLDADYIHQLVSQVMAGITADRT